MIRANLQLFAKTRSYMQEYRKKIAIEKRKLIDSGQLRDEVKEREKEKEKEREKKSPLSSPENITNSEKISKKENYVLYRVNESGKIDGKMERTGKQLYEPLADERLIYDKNSKTWHWKTKDKKGFVSFIIRRKR